MSNAKITPKNLSYDTSLPPFLQRMQANNTSNADGRHERAIARPRKARTKEDEEDDAPLIVDERGWVVEDDGEGKAETGTKAAGDGQARKGEEDEGAGDVEKMEEGKEKIAAIGGARKRKVGKVVGAEEGDDEEGGHSKSKITKSISGDKDGAAKTDGTDTKAKVGGKKKGKKIKLSFGDDD